MKTKVLFVEDNAVDQIALKRAIERTADLDFQVVATVTEAREKLSRQKFEVVVTDFELKDGTCFDFCDALSDIPFIVITGGGNEELAVEAMKTGASDYLVKDLEGRYLTLLPAVIKATLENRRSRQMHEEKEKSDDRPHERPR